MASPPTAKLRSITLRGLRIQKCVGVRPGGGEIKGEDEEENRKCTNRTVRLLKVFLHVGVAKDSWRRGA